MDCEQAHQLFDAYLDAELSPRLMTELGAHRLQCPECRRTLALMEVTGHIISSDDEPAVLNAGFSERLLACMDSPGARWKHRVRRVLYIAGPLAAAAVVMLAFVGVFDSPPIQVAGQMDKGSPKDLPSEFFGLAAEDGAPDDQEAAERDRELERSMAQIPANLQRKGQSVESLKNNLDMTFTQLLKAIDEAEEKPPGEGHLPPGEEAAAPASPEGAPTDDADVEAP